MTTLMVTHDLPYALQLCPRAVVMNDGVIVADGPTREILADVELDGRQPARASLRLRPRSVTAGRPGLSPTGRSHVPRSAGPEPGSPFVEEGHGVLGRGHLGPGPDGTEGLVPVPVLGRGHDVRAHVHVGLTHVLVSR